VFGAKSCEARPVQLYKFSVKANIFQHNAQVLRKLKNDIELSYPNRDRDEQHRLLWVNACERFHNSFDELAFPGGLTRELSLLKEADEQAIELAIRFLEVDPWFFRSGYIKEQLLRLIARVELSDNQQERLRSVILERIETGGRREFRKYSQLARQLDVPTFRKAVLERAELGDVHIRRRAWWILTSLERSGRTKSL